MLTKDRCDHCGVPEARFGDLRACHGYLCCDTCIREAEPDIARRRREDDQAMREMREANLRERMRT